MQGGVVMSAGALATIENWLSPVTQPLNDMNSALGDMQAAHEDAVNQFNQLIKGLDDFDPVTGEWSGMAADNALEVGSQYVTDALDLTGVDAPASVVAEATTNALEGVTEASVDLVADVADDAVITEVTGAVDAADVLQGGMDPITDVIGIILTGLTILLYLDAIATFAWGVYQVVVTWMNVINQADSKPQPRLPRQPVASSQADKIAEQLKKQYGITIDADTIQELLDAGYTPEEIVALIRDMVKKGYTPGDIEKIVANLTEGYAKNVKNVKPALTALLSIGLTPAQVVQISDYFPKLGNQTSFPASSYIKGKPGDDPYADILAAALMEYTQEEKAKLKQLQSAVNQVRKQKGSTLTQAEVIAAVGGPFVWNSLPPQVQNLLLGKFPKGAGYKAYGNAMDALVKQQLEEGSGNLYTYYVKHFDLQIGTEAAPGQKPDFYFTDPTTGQRDVFDLTSTANMPSKSKYLNISGILIAIGY